MFIVFLKQSGGCDYTIGCGVRRTLIRITLDCNYENSVLQQFS